MLPNGHQYQQYAPAPVAPQISPAATMDGSRSVQNGPASNLNAAFSNISLSDNKSPSPSMPRFRPSLPVFRPPASLQSSGYGTESSGASTPTSTRPTMPSFPHMPHFASPSLSASPSHPVLPTGMEHHDYQQSKPQAPVQPMQDGVGQGQQSHLPNSLSHPSQLNYFGQNQPPNSLHQQTNMASSSYQEHYTSSSQAEPQNSTYTATKSSNSFAPGVNSPDVENNLYSENPASQVNQQPFNQPDYGQNAFNHQSSNNGQFGQAAAAPYQPPPPSYSSSNTHPQQNASLNNAYNPFPSAGTNQGVPSGGGAFIEPALQRYPPAQKVQTPYPNPSVSSYPTNQPGLQNGNFAPPQFPAAAQQNFPQGQPGYALPTAFPGPQAGNFQQPIPNGNLSFQGGSPMQYPGGQMQGGPQGSAAMHPGGQAVNLLQSRKILPPDGPELPTPVIRQNFYKENCSPHIFRCTLGVIPKTPALLQKSRLPLGILIHPYKDLSNLQVLSTSTIVRCRVCRSYINPFITFVDQMRWKCNLCDRQNDLPQDFFIDATTRSVGDPSRRPEVQSATLEYIAPSEYSLRPPQPAIYVFLLDISFNAIESRYLNIFCERLSAVLERLPGDARTQVCFIAFDSAVHFFQYETDWKMLSVPDIDDIFIPSTEGILVRLHENITAIRELLSTIPDMFKGQRETQSCMGAAVQAAYRMLSGTGGRITVLQTCLPTIGPGALKSREDPNMRAAKEVNHLQPATDFYKGLALECSASQVAVDLFVLAGQYADLATLSGISRYSSGWIHYYPSFNVVNNIAQVDKFQAELTRYLTRKIGFESVMRVRCTNGLSMHSFHGNFFVRSTDLLSLANVNPDAGFAVQIKMDETLSHTNAVDFQAALLYTSSRGERRIRVHTMHIPISDSLPEIMASADQEAIVCLIGKIAAERALSTPMSDVRDGVVFACEDALSAYTQIARPSAGQLLAPYSLRLLPLFSQALLKTTALRLGVSTTLDLRTAALLNLKAAPLFEEMMSIYPHLYAVHRIDMAPVDQDGVPQLERLQLSAEYLERGGVYLMETVVHMILYVQKGVSPDWLNGVFDVQSFMGLQDRTTDIPALDTEMSYRLRAFISHRYAQRPLHPVVEVIKEDSQDRLLFLQYLHDDRLDSVASYQEFLTQISQKIKA